LITVLAERPQEILRFRAASWPYQRTFITPLRNLAQFVADILTAFPVEEAVLSTDEVVFEPREVLQLCADNSIELDNFWKFTLRAKGQQNVAELLEAMLGDWIDFVFVPTTESFAIYADHDAYSTFYTPNQSILSELVTKLERAGFKSVTDYTRGTSDKKWR
jgi:hypothetical protein